ncbi:MAG: DinB family protein, partial [Planctomycetes bacterium]|nr:DinB family protein [Planctomycetota bacterium]
MHHSRQTIDHPTLLPDYRRVRARTEALCESLEPEDMVVQSMPEVSPTKWHLAHVTWFFETLVLAAHRPGYAPFDERYGRLFNSYYQSLGKPFARARRGLLTRPTVDEVFDYRRHVDAAMADLLRELHESEAREIESLVTIGLHHEQQHQELMLMDILHVLAQNPLRPAYRAAAQASPTDRSGSPLRWHAFPGTDARIGADAAAFCFDNELPRHAVRLQPFELASRLVTAEEYRRFMADGG